MKTLTLNKDGLLDMKNFTQDEKDNYYSSLNYIEEKGDFGVIKSSERRMILEPYLTAEYDEEEGSYYFPVGD